MRWLRAVTVGAAFVVCSTASAYAGAVMQINNGTAYLFSNEVHPVSSPSITVTENGNGNPALADPLLLIVGVPNTTSYAAPAMSLSAGGADLGGTGNGTNSAFGGTFNGKTGLATANAGVFNSGEIYSFIGLTSGDNSNSFGNWASWDSTVNGLTANSFGIFVYELSNTGMTGGSTITATFNGSIPVGTFVVAYGQDASGNAYTTPFTQSGLSTGNTTQSVPTPEPTSLLLLGTGMSAAYARRRRLNRCL